MNIGIRVSHKGTTLQCVLGACADERILGRVAVVIIHNHPSGDPTPSPEDHELTRRLVAAGVVMGIDVVDHIVLGDVRYWSFKEMGQL